MSRNRLTALTALALTLLAVGVGLSRYAAVGEQSLAPPGESSWEVTITAAGALPDEKHTSVVSTTPPDFRRQHVYDVSAKSEELTRREGKGTMVKPHTLREIHWSRTPSTSPPKRYRLTHSFKCVLGIRKPTPPMREGTKEFDAKPAPETDGTLQATSRIQCEHADIAAKAQVLTDGVSASTDQVQRLYDFVAALEYDGLEGKATALDCLKNGMGDDSSRNRLLVALCRNRKIPARLVSGIVLNPNSPPALHHWAEAFVHAIDAPEGHWVPMDPTYGHFGAREWPVNYLVVRLDDEPLVRGPGPALLSLYARALNDRPPADETAVQAFWRHASFAGLSPTGQQLVRFLLVLPLATVIVCVFRVVIGLTTYGIFGPALLGLVFRDPAALPIGLGIFIGTVLVGWMLRKALDRFNLLLVPRTAVMLTMIVVFLMVVVVVATRAGVTVTNYVALFPLIILTHMVERFWTVEAEDGTRASFRTLLGTVAVSLTVALALGPDAVGRWMFLHPETLCLVVAALLLLGRYTGYRLTELYRFEDVIEFKPEPPAVVEASVSLPGPAKEPAVASATGGAP